jgi:hypothetical protein
VTAKLEPDVVVLVSSWPAAMRWATRNGYRRPLFPYAVTDLAAVPASCDVYADLSLWDHSRAASLLDWLHARLQAAGTPYEPRAWVAKYRSSELN